MILQSLVEYYQRKQASSNASLAPEGFEYKEIPFIIVLDREGNCTAIESTEYEKDKRKRYQQFLVPKDCGRTSGIKANLLWDKPDYILGYASIEETEKNKLKIKQRHEAFKAEIEQAFPKDFSDQGIIAVRKFLEDAKKIEHVYLTLGWKKVLESSNAFMSFQLLEESQKLVCESPAVFDYLLHNQKTDIKNEKTVFCSLTGKKDTLAELHTLIKGVYGANTSGASLVSFNAEAFTSFGKKSGENASIGKRAEDQYTKALNSLLGKDSKQKIQLADTTVVFWAKKPTNFENELQPTLTPNEEAIEVKAPRKKDNPDHKNVQTVKKAYESTWKGTPYKNESDNEFYLLGLSPNAARLAVRLWHVSNVAKVAENISQHFDDLEIIHGEKESGSLPIIRLLQSIAVQGKRDNIPSQLEGELLKSILTGSLYPKTLLQLAIQRCRTEQAIPFARASLIKACLNRKLRKSMNKELMMSLDETNTSPGYCLGRLFATLEKTQEDASGGNLNSTIADRYLGAASSRPFVAFAPLLRLNRHHLAKIENPSWVNNHKRRLGEIMEKINGGFPAQLNLEEQGKFFVGYYHQRQAFFKKTDKAETAILPEATAV